MNRTTHRIRRAATATAVVAAGAALLVAATASAAPVSPTAPVPGTQCNVGQVERATAKVAPEFWQHISGNPKAKERFEQALVQTPEQRTAAREAAKKDRQAKIDEWKKANPGKTPPQHGAGKPGGKHDGTPRTKPSKEQVEQKIAQVKATCATS
ncbi:hypothetical protein GCM10009551_105900 [Nocardiopsis tropica]